jgi:aspartyl-tRNA synthetase
MAFVEREDILGVIDGLIVHLMEELRGEKHALPLPRLTYREAMERYGTDKPDLRFGLEIRDLTHLLGPGAAPFLSDARSAGSRLRGIVVPGGAGLTRKELDVQTAAARAAGAGGLLWARRTASSWEGQGVKALGAELLAGLGGAEGDLLLGAAGPDPVTSAALNGVRLSLGRRPGAARERTHAFCWVVDFPLFELDPESGRQVPAHHPFTAPHPEDLAELERDPSRVRALHYDAVYNGTELGSGSIRITDAAVQHRIFELLGIPEPEIRRRFGFLLDGLAAGAPPHGGFALGFDRITMLLAGAGSLRDVIAFPKTTAARALFEGAPTPVDPAELRVLHLQPFDD